MSVKPSNRGKAVFSVDVFYIDEIGKMECFSDKFKKLFTRLLDSEKPVIATIAFRGEGIIGEIKKRNDVQLFVMTRNNRDLIFADILKLMM